MHVPECVILTATMKKNVFFMQLHRQDYTSVIDKMIGLVGLIGSFGCSIFPYFGATNLYNVCVRVCVLWNSLGNWMNQRGEQKSTTHW